MKVLVNGGLNLSELDGWWAEAYSPDVGWALGDGLEHGDDPWWEAMDANELYDLLEREVVPEFYQRDPSGLPTAWISRIRESMARLTPYFSANRSVREYTDRYYVPAAAAYRRRAADGGAAGAEVAAWRQRLDQHWPAVRFGEVTVNTSEGTHTIAAQVYIDPSIQDDVRVELCAEASGGHGAVREPMSRERPLDKGGWVFTARVPADRPAIDYTARVVPQHPGVAIPLEDARILWQR
jgi:starch phosphorylase